MNNTRQTEKINHSESSISKWYYTKTKCKKLWFSFKIKGTIVRKKIKQTQTKINKGLEIKKA